MNFIKKRWEEFKSLQWYWKVLAIVPLILLVLVVFISSPITGGVNKVIKRHNKKVSEQVQKIIKEEKERQKQREKIDDKIKELDKEQNKINKNLGKKRGDLNEILSEIHNAGGDINKLSRIAERLRRK